MRKWATNSPVTAGLALVVAGFIALFLAWNGAAGIDYVQGQIPYLLSGGLVAAPVVRLERLLGKSFTLKVTNTSAFARTAAARTCRSFGSLAIPSTNDSYPVTSASGKDRAIRVIRRSTLSGGIPRSITFRRSSLRTSADHSGR